MSTLGLTSSSSGPKKNPAFWQLALHDFGYGPSEGWSPRPRRQPEPATARSGHDQGGGFVKTGEQGQVSVIPRFRRGGKPAV